MKIQQLQSRIALWMVAIVAGVITLATAPAHGTATIIFTATATTLSTSGNTQISIFAETVGGSALSGSGFTLQIQMGDGGPWGSPNGTATGANGFPQRSDALGPVMDLAAGNLQPTGGLFVGDTISGTPQNHPVDPNYAGDSAPLQSQVYTLSASFLSPKSVSASAPVLLATIMIDGSNLPAGVYGKDYAFTLMGTSNGSSLFGTGGHNAGPGTAGQPAVNETLPSLSQGPEPASLGFLAIVLPGILMRRRRGPMVESEA